MKSPILFFAGVLAGCSGLAPALLAQAIPLEGNTYINLRKSPTDSQSFVPDGTPGGNVFIWWPSRAALKAGRQNSGSYGPNVVNTGEASIALGDGASAEAESSVAIGAEARAVGLRSSAFGYFSAAQGQGSTAVGVGAQAAGLGSLALQGYAEGDYSLAAMGGAASGMNSVAIGKGGLMPGGESDYAALAYGNYSIAIGGGAYAGGQRSVALGWSRAVSVGGLSAGSFNKGLKKDGGYTNELAPSDGDPIFELGNGHENESGAVYSNAFTVFRDGTIRMSKASGGIAMGQFQ